MLALSPSGGGLPYKVYTALLTQSGSLAGPTAKVLQNTLGGAVVFSIVSDGVYGAILGNAFVADKTALICGTPTHANAAKIANFGATRVDVNSLLLETREFSEGAIFPVNDLLVDTFFEIRVYP